MSEHHGLHGGTQRLQQVFTLVGYTAGQPDDLREKDVNQVGNAYRKIMNIGIHNLLCGGIPCAAASKAVRPFTSSGFAASTFSALSGWASRASFVMRISAVALASASRQPGRPQVQRGASGVSRTTMCPASRQRRCSLSAVFHPVQRLHQRRFPK